MPSSPTVKPVYSASDFCYAALSETQFGHLLRDNGRDLVAIEGMLHVLTGDSAQGVWSKTFGDAKHKFKIESSKWTRQLEWNAIGDWMVSYNSSNSHPVEDLLKSRVDWPYDEPVLFIRGPCDGIFTNWITFVRNWLTFAGFDDDGPYLIPFHRDEVVRISPVGQFLVGRTPTR